MLFSLGPAGANPTPSKIGNSTVLVLYCCLRGTPKPNGLKQQLTFPPDSWVSSAQQGVLLFHVTSAGVAQATAVSWESDWVWDVPDGLIHSRLWQLASCWLSRLCCPPPGLCLSSRRAQASHPAVLFKGAETEAARLLKAWLPCHMATLLPPSIGPGKSPGQPGFKGRGNGLSLSSFSMRGRAGGQLCRPSAGCHHSPIASEVPDRREGLSSKVHPSTSELALTWVHPFSACPRTSFSGAEGSTEQHRLWRALRGDLGRWAEVRAGSNLESSPQID